MLNFFIERYKDAYKNQLYDFSKFIKKNIRPLAQFEEGREEEDKISSVHYIRFLFSDDDKKLFNQKEKIKLGINYKDYNYAELLSDKMLTSLIADIN